MQVAVTHKCDENGEAHVYHKAFGQCQLQDYRIYSTLTRELMIKADRTIKKSGTIVYLNSMSW